METLKEKQLRILNETALAYNSNTRSVVEGNKNCVYFKEGHQGCAVGRLIADKELCKQLDICVDSNGNAKNTSVNDPRIFRELPSEVQELTIEFLSALQMLHDDIGHLFWDEDGLSINGRNRFNEIKLNFDL